MRKAMQKSVALMLAVFMMFGAAPIMGITLLASAAEPPVLKSLSIVPEALTLTKVGQTMQLTLEPEWKDADNPGTINDEDVTWVSDSKEYLTVSDTGLIKVVKLPSSEDKTVTVTAKYVSTGSDSVEMSPTATITLKKTDPDNSKLIGMTVSPESVTLKEVGDTCQLYAIGTFDGLDNPSTVTKGVLWSSNNDKYVKVSSTGLAEVVLVPASNAEDVTVTITAVCQGADGKMVSSKCLVTVPKKHIYVERLNLDWALTTVVSEIEYKFDEVFKYSLYLSETPPAGVEVNKNVTLTCDPADKMVIDNENKTIKVLPISTETAVCKLTLTAEDPSPNCKPLEIPLTIRRDVVLTEVKWDYKVGSTKKTGFKYYDTSTGLKQIAEYYYQETVGNVTTKKYHIEPAYAADLCKIKVTSSDTRVLRVDEKTNRLIPVGNGEAKLTITATPPKGVAKSDTIIVVVSESPYNPITDVKIGYDESTATNATYDSKSNTLSLMYGESIKLKPILTPENAKLNQEEIVVRTTDNRKLTTVKATTYSWTSSNTDVATIDKDGKITVKAKGTTVITLRIEDNDVEFVKTINVKTAMSWWEVLVAVLISIFTFHFDKIPLYLGQLF